LGYPEANFCKRYFRYEEDIFGLGLNELDNLVVGPGASKFRNNVRIEEKAASQIDVSNRP